MPIGPNYLRGTYLVAAIFLLLRSRSHSPNLPGSCRHSLVVLYSCSLHFPGRPKRPADCGSRRSSLPEKTSAARKSIDGYYSPSRNSTVSRIYNLICATSLLSFPRKNLIKFPQVTISNYYINCCVYLQSILLHLFKYLLLNNSRKYYNLIFVA